MSEKSIIEHLPEKHQKLKSEISKIIVGQDPIIETILLAIYCKGHSLLIGVPGLAKTLMIDTVAKALGLDFKRIQFTPDLMPSDIIGSEILDTSRNFKFIKGPIFSNIILADEINRTPPKTQSALLEAMQEQYVTVGGERYKINCPFFVLATQNPIEQEGTYPLPEAQLDRFMFAVELQYPKFEEEVAIVKRTTSKPNQIINAILKSSDVLDIQNAILKMPATDSLIDYAVSISHKSRPTSDTTTETIKEYVDWGAGPRASQNLILTAKAHAAVNGKFSPDKEDVKAVAHNILRHRIIKNYKAEAEGVTINQIIDSIL